MEKPWKNDEKWRDDDHCVRWWLAYFSWETFFCSWCLKRMNHWIWLKKLTHMGPLGKEPAAPTHCLAHQKKLHWRDEDMCSFTFHPKTTNKTWEETIAAKVNQFDLPTSFKSRSGKDKHCVRLCLLFCFEAISLSSSTVMVATSSSLVVTTWHILQDQQQKVATSGTFFDQRFSLVNGLKHVMQTYLTRHAHQKAAEKTPPNQVMMVCGSSLLPNAAPTRISSLLIWVIRVSIKAWYPGGILPCVYHHYAWIKHLVETTVTCYLVDIEWVARLLLLSSRQLPWMKIYLDRLQGLTRWCMCMYANMQP